MKTNRIISVVVTSLAFTAFYGCTGTQMIVKPDPNTIQISVQKKCGSVAVKETTPDRVYPPAGNLIPGFANELERSGLFETVYYPTRPDDKVDIALDSKFNVKFQPNMGGNMTKAFFTGLTLFILEPIFWYDYDYALDAKVDIYSGKSIVKTIDAGTTAEINLKFLSLGQIVNLEGETLKNAKLSIYKQLLIKINDYCGSK
jgi:hypothetical protein